MPFSTERTEFIKARIQERLNSGLANQWEQSFLTNMKERFDRYGQKTRLSDAQYCKLSTFLKLGSASPKPPSTPTNRQSGEIPDQHISKAQSRSGRPSANQWSRPSARFRSPFHIANSPRRAIRRLERKLFLPILVVMGLVALISFASGPPTSTQRPATSTQQKDIANYVVVTGTRVNQREGPSTANRVTGQLMEGTRVQKVGDQEGWSQIVSTLGVGWMSSDYLSSTMVSPSERASNRTTSPTTSRSPQNVRTVNARDIHVIDGDTVTISGQSANVRLVGFNTPETRSPSCSAELKVGRRATARLKVLVSEARSIQFERVACACRPGTEGTKKCNCGRQCGSLVVDGTDVGTTLIKERLAVRYLCGATSCPPRPGNWCR